MPPLRNVEELATDARVTVRRGGPPNTEGRCVVYWMQRAQRALDNPALDVAIEAANALHKPVVVFLGLTPFYPNANLRSYTFFVQGFRDIGEGLLHRNAGWVLRRWPDHEPDRFCEQVQPCLVVGDENPMREPERWRKAGCRSSPRAFLDRGCRRGRAHRAPQERAVCRADHQAADSRLAR